LRHLAPVVRLSVHGERRFNILSGSPPLLWYSLTPKLWRAHEEVGAMLRVQASQASGRSSARATQTSRSNGGHR